MTTTIAITTPSPSTIAIVLVLGGDQPSGLVQEVGAALPAEPGVRPHAAAVQQLQRPGSAGEETWWLLLLLLTWLRLDLNRLS